MTEFRVGDEVFGIEGGANAEYVAVRESGVIARKPAGLTFEEAAAVPDGSLLALTCLRPADPLRGKSVLVYGAAGSIGTARGPAPRAPLRGRGDGGVRHEGRRGRAVAGSARGPRSLPRGLHEERQDVRRDLRRGRQALVPPLPALARSPAGPTSRPTSGSCTTCRSSRSSTRFVGSRRAKLAHRPLSQGGPSPRQGARRGGQVPARDRPDATRSTRSSRRPATSRPARRRATSCSA